MTAVLDTETLKTQASPEKRDPKQVAGHIVDTLEAHDGLPKVDFNFRATFLRLFCDTDKSLAGSDLDPYTRTPKPAQQYVNPEYAVLVAPSMRVA